METKKYFT